MNKTKTYRLPKEIIARLAKTYRKENKGILRVSENRWFIGFLDKFLDK